MASTPGLALHGHEVARRRLGSWLLSVTHYERDSSIPSHLHIAPYATVVVRGGYEEIAGGRARQCDSRSIVVHAPGERHADRFRGPTTCLNIQGGRFELGGVIPPAAAGVIASKLRSEFLKPDDLSPQIVEALMLELDALSRRHGGLDDRAPTWLGEVRQLLESSFQEPLAIATLAASAGVHPTHLARSFRQHYGLTIGERIRELRVEQARKQLSGGRALADIAAELGFADQSHFTRVFRRATGTTPAAFRHAARATKGGLRRDRF
ncbi:MAG: AraC family transcriptional regulator [Acidobacteriota bacterium]